MLGRTPQSAGEAPGLRSRAIPSEIVLVLATVAALFLVVGAGALFTAVLPPLASPWLFAASYGAPGAVAFAVYWWMAQRG